jgi:8-hydroxy-5-deazaflavin:NADPH oxidoreductase
MKKIGIVGSGPVGQALAKGFIKHGYNVMMGSRDKSKYEQIHKETGAPAGSFEEVAAFGEVIVIAVKGTAAEAVVSSLAKELTGKTVIDTSNPIKEAPPVNGVLQFFTSFDESLFEILQKKVPGANFVKAFNSVGNALMIDPDFGTRPSMFICGNNAAAKKDVTTIINSFGWDAEDMGKAESARAIEPLCMLWCIPGMLENRWTDHAFKLLKKTI